MYVSSHFVGFSEHHCTQNTSFYGSAYSESQVFAPGTASNLDLNDVYINLYVFKVKSSIKHPDHQARIKTKMIHS